MENNVELVTLFCGYKYRKQNDLLYSVDAKIPRSLINLYFNGKVDRIDPSIINKRFVDRYIKNECAMENIHEKEEMLGLEVMYEDMMNTPLDEFELFSLSVFNKDLYSKCPYPDAGGKLRESDSHLEGRPTDLCPHGRIFEELLAREPLVNNIKELATYMKESQDYSRIFDYINMCVRLNADLLKIHPFSDGNGRTIRCFTNKLFVIAGIPPVYIKPEEKQDYMRGLLLAQNENYYDEINAFYLYKICDSIIELDINNRIKQERKLETYDVKKKSNSKNNKRK